ncbi:MAG: hypothetical protein JWL70_2229 [Acidimicrobiia bacterium]|nr:hypothetical protein [Acidimicrobiia bacterium]
MPRPTKQHPAPATFVWWWAVATSLWLMLAATLARPDVIAAVAAGGLTAVAAAYRHRLGVVNYSLRLRWLRHLPRLPVQVAQDLLVLARALLHPDRVHSAFRAVAFDSGGNGPHDVGRRGLLALAASLGPNTFVVGFEPDRQLLLVHQLVINDQVLPLPDGKFPPP